MDFIKAILRTLSSKIGCGSSQVRVVPQKVTEAWASDEENKGKRSRLTAKDSKLVQSRTVSKTAFSSSESSVDAKKISMKQTKKHKKPSKSHVVLVREGKKEHTSPSPQASSSHSAVRISSCNPSANSKGSGKRSRLTAKDSKPVQNRTVSKTDFSSSGSSIDAKKMKQTKKHQKPSKSHVVLVREAKKEHTSPSPQTSSSHSAVRSSRKHSANSNGSDMSNNSGLEGEYAHIITEKSDPVSQEIARLPQNMKVPKLRIEGVQLATSAQQVRRRRYTRPPAKQPQPPRLPNNNSKIRSAFCEVEFHECHKVLQCPNFRGGVAFEVQVGTGGLEGDGRLRKRKPAAVKKLERKPRQRGQTTKEELEKKQIAAEKRRKELEQKLVERFKARKEKEKEIKESISKFISMLAEETEAKDVEGVQTAKKCRKLPPLKPLKQPKICHDDIPVVFGVSM